MKHVEEKLKALEKDIDDLNDGSKIITSISTAVKESVMTAVDSANATDSIDERIQLLIAGFQEVLNKVTSFQKDFNQQKYTLQTKISVLEEIIDEYIANEDHDLTEE